MRGVQEGPSCLVMSWSEFLDCVYVMGKNIFLRFKEGMKDTGVLMPGLRAVMCMYDESVEFLVLSSIFWHHAVD